MSDAIAELRTEPDLVLSYQAKVSVMFGELTLGTNAENVTALMTDHPLVIRPDPQIAREEWSGLLAASEASSLSFLASEPDLYGEEDGEPI